MLVEADAADGAGAAGRARRASAAGLDSLAQRLRELNRRGARRGCAESDPEALGFLDAIERALPDDAIVVCDMCIPGYWLGGFHRTAAPAQAHLPARLGHARVRVPAGPRRGAGRRRAGS